MFAYVLANPLSAIGLVAAGLYALSQSRQQHDELLDETYGAQGAYGVRDARGQHQTYGTYGSREQLSRYVASIPEQAYRDAEQAAYEEAYQEELHRQAMAAEQEQAQQVQSQSFLAGKQGGPRHYLNTGATTIGDRPNSVGMFGAGGAPQQQMEYPQGKSHVAYAYDKMGAADLYRQQQADNTDAMLAQQQRHQLDLQQHQQQLLQHQQQQQQQPYPPPQQQPPVRYMGQEFQGGDAQRGQFPPQQQNRFNPEVAADANQQAMTTGQRVLIEKEREAHQKRLGDLRKQRRKAAASLPSEEEQKARREQQQGQQPQQQPSGETDMDMQQRQAQMAQQQQEQMQGQQIMYPSDLTGPMERMSMNDGRGGEQQQQEYQEQYQYEPHQQYPQQPQYHQQQQQPQPQYPSSDMSSTGSSGGGAQPKRHRDAKLDRSVAMDAEMRREGINRAKAHAERKSFLNAPQGKFTSGMSQDRVNQMG